MTYYKWLLPERTTPIQEVAWPVRVKQWTTEETPVLCRSGWHGIEAKDILEHFPEVLGSQLWEVEVKGEIVHGADKFCASQMRLVRMVSEPSERTLRLFACEVAEDVLWIYEKHCPGDTRVRECIEVSRRYAMGEATEEELAAAQDAASAAAWTARDAAWTARDAAWTAWDAAWTARDAAWTARNAAWTARDAAWTARNAASAASAAWAASRAKYNTLFCAALGVELEESE